MQYFAGARDENYHTVQKDKEYLNPTSSAPHLPLNSGPNSVPFWGSKIQSVSGWNFSLDGFAKMLLFFFNFQNVVYVFIIKFDFSCNFKSLY